MGRIWLMTTWLCATVMVSWLTFQALDAADAGVRDSPRTAVVVGSIPSAQGAALDRATPTTGVLPSETPPASVAVTPDTTTASTTPLSEQSSENASPPPTSPPATTPPTTSAPTTTPTTAPATTSTTAPTTTTTTAPTTTTTTAQQSWTTTTIPSPGGSLTVSYRPGEVRYEAAVPAAGYELEIESIEPDDIKVAFEDDEGNGWDIRARWKDGEFETEVDSW